MKFIVYKEPNNRWYWELRALDDVVVAISPKGLTSQQSAFAEIQNLRSLFPSAPVFDLLGTCYEGI